MSFISKLGSLIRGDHGRVELFPPGSKDEKGRDKAELISAYVTNGVKLNPSFKQEIGEYSLKTSYQQPVLNKIEKKQSPRTNGRISCAARIPIYLTAQLFQKVKIFVKSVAYPITYRFERLQGQENGPFSITGIKRDLIALDELNECIVKSTKAVIIPNEKYGSLLGAVSRSFKCLAGSYHAGNLPIEEFRQTIKRGKVV
jgi:hypothetical protein